MMDSSHYKFCFSRALLCAVENLRDDEHTYMNEFAQADFAAIALSYYDGLIDCICHLNWEAVITDEFGTTYTRKYYDALKEFVVRDFCAWVEADGMRRRGRRDHQSHPG